MDKLQSAAAQMYDDLMDGTFYEKQEKACPTTKYIYEPKKKKERTWDEIEKALEDVLD
jgi:hypothetical protein